MTKYEIYNGFNNTLLDDDTVVEAKNARVAVKKFLDDNNIKYTSFKASGDNDVHIKTTPFIYNAEGLKQRTRQRCTWWKVAV